MKQGQLALTVDHQRQSQLTQIVSALFVVASFGQLTARALRGQVSMKVRGIVQTRFLEGAQARAITAATRL